MARILVIDDERPIREMLRAGFEEAGFDVCAAADGKEGIRLFHEQPADLVITDILMPDQDGLEVIRVLHRSFPGVKIIAISGKGMGGDLDFLIEAELFGAVSTMAKPFTWPEMLRVAHSVLGLASAPSSARETL